MSLLLPIHGLPPFFKKKTQMSYDTSCHQCRCPLPRGTPAFYCVSPSGSRYICETCSTKRDYYFEVTPDMFWELAVANRTLKDANENLSRDLNKAITWIKELTNIIYYEDIYEELQDRLEWEEDYEEERDQ